MWQNRAVHSVHSICVLAGECCKRNGAWTWVLFVYTDNGLCVYNDSVLCVYIES